MTPPELPVITFILLIAALVCFLLATFGVTTGRVAVGWLGAALITITLLIGAYPA